MAKANFKTLMMAKGERYALYASIVLMLLFVGLGVMNLTSATDPAELTKKIEGHTNKITQTVNSPGGTVPELPAFAMGVHKHDLVKAGDSNNLLFDPISPPDSRRINPVVKSITEIQLDFVAAKILAYDIRDLENGDKEIGVLKYHARKTDMGRDKQKEAEFIKDYPARGGKKAPIKKPRPNPNPMGMMGGAAGGMKGDGGGIMGQPPGPMGLMGSPPPAVGIKPGGMKGGPGMGGKGTEELAIDHGPRLGIEYVPLDAEKMEGKRPALTIYPQRMIVVQASFPYREQVEAIRQALHLDKINDVFNTPDATPVFKGLVVERQVLAPDGKVIQFEGKDWAPLNFEEKYRETIFPRSVGEKEDDATLLQYVMFLPPEQELVMPLPLLLTGSYAPLRLASIQQTIRKLQAINKPIDVPRPKSRLQSGGSVWERTGVSPVAAAGQPQPGGDVNIPKIPKKGNLVNVQPKDSGQGSQSFEIPDQILVRFIDNDIIPDRQYRYRIKLRMVNPNWVGEKDAAGEPVNKQKYDLVSRPSDADIDVIEGKFVESPETVSVPREEFLFAADPVTDPKDAKKNLIKLEPGQGLLQYQRWLALAAVGNYKEPVADWIVADVLVKRGTYVGGKQFVNLPIWSSEYNRYILRELPGEKGSKQTKRGVVMDPTRPGPQYVVVDIEGGMQRSSTPSRTLVDESATEILLLDEDGNLSVRSAVADRSDADRAKREEAWRQWIEKTEKETTAVVPSTGTVPTNKFD